MVAATRRALADRHRHRLLQHDRVLPRRVRAASRPGVDGRADAVVRAASPRWSPTRACAWSIAPRSCSCAARGETPGGGARGRGALHRGVLNQRASGTPLYRRARSIACGASRGPPRTPTGRRAGSAGSRSRAWPCCACARARRDAAAAAIRRAVSETTAPLQRAALLPAYVEIMLAVGERRRRRSACRELEEIAGARQASADSSMAMAAQARGASLADGEPSARWSHLRRALERGRSSGRRTRLRARAC